MAVLVCAFYVRNNIALNFNHLQKRAEQRNNLQETEFTPEIFKQMLKERIERTNIEAVKNDVRPILKNPRKMGIWSTEYFLQLADMIKIDNNILS